MASTICQALGGGSRGPRGRGRRGAGAAPRGPRLGRALLPVRRGGDRGRAHGGAVQVEPMKPMMDRLELTDYGISHKRLKLNYDTVLSIVAYKFNSRRYSTVHLSGQTAEPAPGTDEVQSPLGPLKALDAEQQTAIILARIDRLLAKSGRAQGLPLVPISAQI